MRLMLLLACLAAVAGCGEKRPPAPTAEENRQLDEADRALNEMGGGAT